MKRCPTCQRTYPDDAPAFCVNDGVQLVTEGSSPGYDPQKTMLASAPPPPPQYSNPQPPPVAQQQAVWPPPPPPPPSQQQGQNWGGGYYPQPGQQPYGSPYAQQTVKSNKLSLTALITGCLSGLLGLLLLSDYMGWAHIFTLDSGKATIIATVVLGAVSLVLGAIALFSSRQRSKALAVIGMVLSAASIAFYIYLETEYGIFF